MLRCLQRACAGVLLLAAAGCTVGSFFTRQVVVWGPKVMVSGTVAEVAAKLRDGLGGEGLLLRTHRIGPDYRISSQSMSGTVFCLHLQQISEEDGIQTRVRMQWDRGGDKELWQLVLKILKAPSEEESASNPQPESPASP